jgi:NAD-dependent SIR2 family protein deacetylase
MKHSETNGETDTGANGFGLPSLVSSLASGRLILFVGGGISESLGLPDFRCLVQHVREELGLGEQPFNLGEYPVIAEAYLLKHGKLGALRSWLDETLHPANIDITRSEIHNLIVDLNFPIIYTTNYDRWLERAFAARQRPFHKIASVADLTEPSGSRTEIIKFHGDFEDDDSLVLTETSYFRRMSFESPLDIRLRSDCLARPMLFIGYSLHDMNTRFLLFRLQELWQNSPYTHQRPISYVTLVERDEAQERVLEARGVKPINLSGKDPTTAVAEFLRKLKTEVQRVQDEAGCEGCEPFA